jgi:hypothetical protein
MKPAHVFKKLIYDNGDDREKAISGYFKRRIDSIAYTQYRDVEIMRNVHVKY